MRPRHLVTPAVTLLLAILVTLAFSGRRDDRSMSVVPLDVPDLMRLGVHMLLDDGRGVWPVARWAEHMAFAARIMPPGGWVPWLLDPRVVGVSLFALDGNPAEWAHTNLLRVDADGMVTGAHTHFDLLARLVGAENSAR
ncbi:MAG: hypothetical protein ACOCXZ_02475 [Chloroflexota bacterium]